MPDRSGWEVARAVKDSAAAMPVALITGWGLTISEEEGRRRGVDLVIKKPVAPQRLLAALAELLGR
jgi:DNA-binding response OmpR family regulator